MRAFESFNQSGEDVCPVCQTNESKSTVLIPIPGTEEGNIMQAKQVHEKCYNDIKAIITSVIHEFYNQ